MAPPVDGGLTCCYKRYRPGEYSTGDKDSIALVLAHAITTRKKTSLRTLKYKANSRRYGDVGAFHTILISAPTADGSSRRRGVV